jgi:hypothetical protein
MKETFDTSSCIQLQSPINHRRHPIVNTTQPCVFHALNPTMQAPRLCQLFLVHPHSADNSVPVSPCRDLCSPMHWKCCLAMDQGRQQE